MNTSKPFFSVVIPLYNKRPHIQRSVKSVLNQTFQEFELIVVDDGSTDGSVEELENVTDSKLKIYKKENGGVSSARNFGIKQARADYVAFLDADDKWDMFFLETIYDMHKLFPDKGMYITAYKIENDGIKINRIVKNKKTVFKIENYFQEFLKLGGPVNDSSATVVKKELFFKIGMFSEKLINFEDWNVSFKMALLDDVIYSQKVVASYYLDTVNRCSSENLKIKLSMYDMLIIDIEDFIFTNKLQRQDIDLVFQRQAGAIMKSAIINKTWDFFEMFKKSKLYNYTSNKQKILYGSILNRAVYVLYKIIKIIKVK